MILKVLYQFRTEVKVCNVLSVFYFCFNTDCIRKYIIMIIYFLCLYRLDNNLCIIRKNILYITFIIMLIKSVKNYHPAKLTRLIVFRSTPLIEGCSECMNIVPAVYILRYFITLYTRNIRNTSFIAAWIVIFKMVVTYILIG